MTEQNKNTNDEQYEIISIEDLLQREIIQPFKCGESKVTIKNSNQEEELDVIEIDIVNTYL